MISKHALPLPFDLSYCMDNMLQWGQSMDREWFYDVVQMLAFTVEDGIPVNKRGIVRDATELKVQVMIHTYYGVGTNQAYLLLKEWEDYFDIMWQNSAQNFNELTVTTTQYIGYRIHQLRHPFPVALPVNSVNGNNSG